MKSIFQICTKMYAATEDWSRVHKRAFDPIGGGPIGPAIRNVLTQADER